MFHWRNRRADQLDRMATRRVHRPECARTAGCARARLSAQAAMAAEAGRSGRRWGVRRSRVCRGGGPVLWPVPGAAAAIGVAGRADGLLAPKIASAATSTRSSGVASAWTPKRVEQGMRPWKNSARARLKLGRCFDRLALCAKDITECANGPAASGARKDCAQDRDRRMLRPGQEAPCPYCPDTRWPSPCCSCARC